MGLDPLFLQRPDPLRVRLAWRLRRGGVNIAGNSATFKLMQVGAVCVFMCFHSIIISQ